MIQVKFDNKYWCDAISLPVYNLEGEIVGFVDYPTDESLLDIIDDPLTVFASDNGLSVYNLDVEFPDNYFG